MPWWALLKDLLHLQDHNHAVHASKAKTSTLLDKYWNNRSGVTDWEWKRNKMQDYRDLPQDWRNISQLTHYSPFSQHTFHCWDSSTDTERLSWHGWCYLYCTSFALLWNDSKHRVLSTSNCVQCQKFGSYSESLKKKKRRKSTITTFVCVSLK